MIASVHRIKLALADCSNDAVLFTSILEKVQISRKAGIFIAKTYLAPFGYTFLEDGIIIDIGASICVDWTKLCCAPPDKLFWDTFGVECCQASRLDKSALSTLQLVGSAGESGMLQAVAVQKMGCGTRTHDFVDKLISFNLLVKRNIFRKESSPAPMLHRKNCALNFDFSEPIPDFYADEANKELLFGFIGLILDKLGASYADSHDLAACMGMVEKVIANALTEMMTHMNAKESKLICFEGPSNRMKRKLNASTRVYSAGLSWFIGRADQDTQEREEPSHAIHDYIRNLPLNQQVATSLKFSRHGLTAADIKNMTGLSSKEAYATSIQFGQTFKYPTDKVMEGKNFQHRLLPTAEDTNAANQRVSVGQLDISCSTTISKRPRSLATAGTSKGSLSDMSSFIATLSTRRGGGNRTTFTISAAPNAPIVSIRELDKYATKPPKRRRFNTSSKTNDLEDEDVDEKEKALREDEEGVSDEEDNGDDLSSEEKVDGTHMGEGDNRRQSELEHYCLDMLVDKKMLEKFFLNFVYSISTSDSNRSLLIADLKPISRNKASSLPKYIIHPVKSSLKRAVMYTALNCANITELAKYYEGAKVVHASRVTGNSREEKRRCRNHLFQLTQTVSNVATVAAFLLCSGKPGTLLKPNTLSAIRLLLSTKTYRPFDTMKDYFAVDQNSSHVGHQILCRQILQRKCLILILQTLSTVDASKQLLGQKLLSHYPPTIVHNVLRELFLARYILRFWGRGSKGEDHLQGREKVSMSKKVDIMNYKFSPLFVGSFCSPGFGSFYFSFLQQFSGTSRSFLTISDLCDVPVESLKARLPSTTEAGVRQDACLHEILYVAHILSRQSDGLTAQLRVSTDLHVVLLPERGCSRDNSSAWSSPLNQESVVVNTKDCSVLSNIVNKDGHVLIARGGNMNNFLERVNISIQKLDVITSRSNSGEENRSVSLLFEDADANLNVDIRYLEHFRLGMYEQLGPLDSKHHAVRKSLSMNSQQAFDRWVRQSIASSKICGIGFHALHRSFSMCTFWQEILDVDTVDSTVFLVIVDCILIDIILESIRSESIFALKIGNDRTPELLTNVVFISSFFKSHYFPAFPAPSLYPEGLPTHPWMSLDGTLNKDAFSMYAARVLGVLTRKPGATMIIIHVALQLLDKSQTRDLLELMVHKGLLRRASPTISIRVLSGPLWPLKVSTIDPTTTMVADDTYFIK